MIYALFLLLAFVAALAYIIFAATGCLAGAVIFGLIFGLAVFINWWLCLCSAASKCKEE